mmetsp:Transcript_27084/g.58743  ORF Transcript_27084/g.58743 Transcript_27084/m.58743 type:complete len:184 (-) Transcript_27084:21-572(-)
MVEEPELVSLTPFFIEVGNGSAGNDSESDIKRYSNKMKRRTSSTHRSGSLPSFGHSLMRLACLAAFLLIGTDTPSSLHPRGQWKRTPAGSEVFETDLLSPNLLTPPKDEAVVEGTSSHYEFLFISLTGAAASVALTLVHVACSVDVGSVGVGSVGVGSGVGVGSVGDGGCGGCGGCGGTASVA